MIKQIEVKNFKTFSYQKIDLGSFNVLIGANASGKSNFLQIFKFISDIAHHGLNNAISMQGGLKYLRHTNIANQENLMLKIVIDSNHPLSYEFSLEFDETGFKIVRDKLAYAPNIEGSVGEFMRNHINGELKTTNTLGELMPDIFKNKHLLGTLKPNKLLLEQPLFKLIMAEMNENDIFNTLSIYDFDPKQPKKAAPIAGKIELEEDTSNLAIVLKNILVDKDKRRQFFNLLTYLLPFVEDVRIEEFTEKHLILSLKENHSNLYLPATFLSEGTINIISLIVALYFDEKPLFLMEEPEKNIYPCHFSKIVAMLKEVSDEKQIIVTTHHSEIVKYTAYENILFILRDKEGASKIIRPYEKEEVKLFLQSDGISIEDLYLDDLLGI